MWTLVVYAVLAIIVMAALVVLAVVALPATEQLADAPADHAPWSLPATDQPLAEADVATMRLPVALRGYRFAETDATLDRLGEEIARRDRIIDDLQRELAGRDVEVPGRDGVLAGRDGETSQGADAVPARGALDNNERERDPAVTDERRGV